MINDSDDNHSIKKIVNPKNGFCLYIQKLDGTELSQVSTLREIPDFEGHFASTKTHRETLEQLIKKNRRLGQDLAAMSEFLTKRLKQRDHDFNRLTAIMKKNQMRWRITVGIFLLLMIISVFF